MGDGAATSGGGFSGQSSTGGMEMDYSDYEDVEPESDPSSEQASRSEGVSRQVRENKQELDHPLLCCLILISNVFLSYLGRVLIGTREIGG